MARAPLPEDRPSDEAIAGFRAGMRSFWHPVLASDSLTDRPVAVELLGQRLVLARMGQSVQAFPDTCAHFQARLSLGKVVEVNGQPALQCPYHGWAFAAGGRCARIPQLPEGRRIPAAADLTAHLAREACGLVWVCLAEAATHDLPPFPEFDDPTFRKIRLNEAEEMATSSTRMIMGTLDDTHFPWVHEGIFGSQDHPEPPEHAVWREDNQLVLSYETEQPAGLMTGGGTEGAVRLRYTNYVGMPNVIRLVKDSPGGRYVIWLATCPLDWNRTRNFWIFARDYDTDPDRDVTYTEMAAHVRQQDKPVIESQRPWLLPPFWSQVELPIRPGDLPLIQYQKWLEELGIVTAI
ncbi:aromatic-ring-hydroxylating dioxygenase subunit alpha [Oceanicola sp. S124]|uniref:aromatic-ring-hydroxylating dioxygenase subunit alpha n=1 Tax=Oceanicola sp. S124 TaxID=1042378 RepID=UPI0002558D7F|nr:aromatic-ring-hydroxylating dioxygenase subunit alpha [Oceanicola sp. S124]